jgi:hypothetical protein
MRGMNQIESRSVAPLMYPNATKVGTLAELTSRK